MTTCSIWHWRRSRDSREPRSCVLSGCSASFAAFEQCAYCVPSGQYRRHHYHHHHRQHIAIITSSSSSSSLCDPNEVKQAECGRRIRPTATRYAPARLRNPDLRPFDIENCSVRVASTVGNLHSKLGHARPFGSRIIMPPPR